MKDTLLERVFDWLMNRGKRVKDGGLYHELSHWRLPAEVIEEVAEKTKTKGYRDG